MENNLNIKPETNSGSLPEQKQKQPTRACTLQAKRNYYQRHKEQILAKHKEWRIANKEKLREIQKESQQRYKQKKELELKLLQKLVEETNDSDEENAFFDRLQEVITISNFYQNYGIQRPIEFFQPCRK